MLDYSLGRLNTFQRNFPNFIMFPYVRLVRFGMQMVFVVVSFLKLSRYIIFYKNDQTMINGMVIIKY